MERRNFLKAIGALGAAASTPTVAEDGAETVTETLEFGDTDGLINPVTGEIVVPAHDDYTLEITYEQVSQ